MSGHAATGGHVTSMAYQADGLHAGAAAHLDIGDAVDRIVGAYAGIAVSSTVFGRVAGASGLSAVLENAQLIRGRAAAAEAAAARVDLAGRVRSAAGFGQQLTGTTTAIAAAVPGAGAVAAGMR